MAFSPNSFAAFLAGAAFRIEHEKDEGLEKACELLEKSAKHAIGTYEFGWRQLEKETQDERERLGYERNEPLLRTGELRDSIEHTVGQGEAWVGSNSMIAVYQELGTRTIPPRSFLSGAVNAKQEEVEKVFGGIVMTAFKK
jgi:phage gpG-like protein